MTKSIEQLLDESETLYVRMPTKHQQFLTLMLTLAVRDLTEAINARDNVAKEGRWFKLLEQAGATLMGLGYERLALQIRSELLGFDPFPDPPPEPISAGDNG
jgi:hypothetical protein